MGTATTVHFLLVYSHGEQRLVMQEEYRDSARALKAYAQAETEYLGKMDQFEIVLIGSDSIETIMKTHGHYFAGDAQDVFADLLTAH